MSHDKNRKLKEKCNLETGFFEDGLPYARIGNKPKFIVNLEALSFKHEPPSGFALKQFIKSNEGFTNEYTIYLVEHKQNVPEDYTFDDMASNYTNMIRREFKKPVIIMGASTGGQIAQYLAANHPDIVSKLIIISAVYRVSKAGAEIEGRTAEYFKQKKYGKSVAALLDLVISSKITRVIAKFFVRLIGKRMLGKIEYPNDFLTEVRGDIEMNFIDRLKDITASALILSGELDIEYTAEDVLMTSERIPNTKLILYNGYGHSLLMKNRKQIEKDISEFINN